MVSPVAAFFLEKKGSCRNGMMAEATTNEAKATSGFKENDPNANSQMPAPSLVLNLEIMPI